MRGESAASSASGRRRKPSSSVVGTMTGVAPDEPHLLGVADPVGRGDDHLVPGLVQREREVEEHVLGAAADDDLLRRGPEAPVPLVGGADRGA